MPDRPRRLVSRYELSLDVHVQPAGLPSLSCQARNVGVGGMFLATDTAPELSSKVAIAVRLPSGRSTSLGARVAHVLTGQKARSLGVGQGIGVQFEGLGRADQAFVEELVAWARAQDPRPRIARKKPGADLRALQDEPMLGFLLGYLDGKRDPEALAEQLALELDTIERMIAELKRHGAIELVSAAEPGQVSQRPAAAVPTVRSKQPSSPPHHERLASPKSVDLASLKPDAALRPSNRPPADGLSFTHDLSRAERLAAAGRLSIPPPAPDPSEDTDEHGDYRLAPPPADAGRTEARTARPPQPGKPSLREPSASARAAAAALRRPSGAPSASSRPTSPPGAAARGSGPASTNAGATRPPPARSGSGRALAAAQRGSSMAARGTQPSAAHSSAGLSGRAAGGTPPLAGDASRAVSARASSPMAQAATPSDAYRAARAPTLEAGAKPSQPPASIRAAAAAGGGPMSASPTQPPPAHARAGRSSRAPGGGTRTGRPSRPVAASQAEAAAQAAAEQAAAAAALITRGRSSEAPGPNSSKPGASEPPLGAAAQILAQAESAYSAGQAAEAIRHLKLLSAMTFDDPRVQARFAELKQKVMRTAAVDFEKQAAFEEKQQHWAQAARSWMRVVEGRPNDSIPLQRAALAQLQAAELRPAMENAKRAVELAPNDAQAHRILAKVYVAADMQASARRELEAAQRCSGASEPGEDTPTGLLKRLLGRDDAG